MPREIPPEDLDRLEQIVRSQQRISSAEIATRLGEQVPRRTLQFWLKHLFDNGRIQREGTGRWARYSAPDAEPAPVQPGAVAIEAVVPLSTGSQEIRAYLLQPLTARKPVGYHRDFLDAYRPRETFYLPEETRARLAETGARTVSGEAAGTYARQILNRLLIELSWNSSRLEGNTYSLLDTKRLLEFGQEADGRDRLEAQMILNHKDAVEFLVENAADIGFNRYTILNLHAILANNLLADEQPAGRLRHIDVGIEGSVYHPPATPQQIEESFEQLLATAAAITDPFEQSMFVMVQLTYLQPFDDVNKRTSRMAANIPFIKANLSPLSFTDLPRDLYVQAILGVYELNRIDLLRDTFIWSYERSAARYAAVRQSLGEPDPFRMRHRDKIRTVIADVVQGRMKRKPAAAHISSWAMEHVDEFDRARFREVIEAELLGLHEGNFARYAIRPREFAAWQEAWNLRVT